MNSARINYWFYDLSLWHRKTREQLQLGIARKLPKWLLYWAMIVCWSKATTGVYGNTDATSITASEVLSRLERE